MTNPSTVSPSHSPVCGQCRIATPYIECSSPTVVGALCHHQSVAKPVAAFMSVSKWICCMPASAGRSPRNLSCASDSLARLVELLDLFAALRFTCVLVEWEDAYRVGV